MLELGFRAYSKQKRCPLDNEGKTHRLTFARYTLRLSRTSLQSWIFTDEKWFDSDDHGDRYEWIDTNDRNAKRSFRIKVQAPVKVMVWGAIGIGFRHLRVLTMPVDEEGRPRRLSGDSFKRQCLMTLRPHKQFLRGRYLMQDGARVHWTPPNTKYVKDVLEMMPVAGWPACSPDLNPIEHLWSIMAKAVDRRGPWGREELERYVREEWDRLAQSDIDKLVLSFRDRLERCVAEDGGHV